MLEEMVEETVKKREVKRMSLAERSVCNRKARLSKNPKMYVRYEEKPLYNSNPDNKKRKEKIVYV